MLLRYASVVGSIRVRVPRGNKSAESGPSPRTPGRECARGFTVIRVALHYHQTSHTFFSDKFALFFFSQDRKNPPAHPLRYGRTEEQVVPPRGDGDARA